MKEVLVSLLYLDGLYPHLLFRLVDEVDEKSDSVVTCSMDDKVLLVVRVVSVLVRYPVLVLDEIDKVYPV